MAALHCEMCGGTDLIKQDGVFICQNCGTKYSVEEAKKMMIEGKVDVSGSTVKIDTSDDLENLFSLARRYKKEDNNENAAKYYDMILVKAPTNWEACFFSVYFKAMSCKLAGIYSAANSIVNNEESVLQLIYKYVPADLQKDAVNEVIERSSIGAERLAYNAKKFYDNIDSSIKNFEYFNTYYQNASESANIMFTCGDMIESIFGSNNQIAKMAVTAWEKGLYIKKDIMNDVNDKYYEYAEKIGKFDSNLSNGYISKEKTASISKTINELTAEIEKNEKMIVKRQKDSKVFIILGIIEALWGIMFMLTMGSTIGEGSIYGGIAFAVIGAFFILGGITMKSPNNKKNVALKESVEKAKKELLEKEKEIKKYQ